MIRRPARTHAGFDLFGVTRTGVVLTLQREKFALTTTIELEQDLGATAAGALFMPEGDLPARLLAGREATLTIGVPEASAAFTATAKTEPSQLMDLAPPRPENQPGLEHAAKLTTPLRHAADGTWAQLDVEARVPDLVQVVDWVHAKDPTIMPRLDARLLAAFRAFLVLDPLGQDDGAALAEHVTLFAHIDLTESLFVPVIGGTPTRPFLEDSGLLHLAVPMAAESGEPLAQALERLLTTGPVGSATVLYTNLLHSAVHQARSRLSLGRDLSREKAEDTAGPTFVTSENAVHTIALSGPLTDVGDRAVAPVRDALPTLREVRVFRPLVEFREASSDARRHAGRYTVALGLALNPPAPLLRFDRLPIDFTPRLRAEYLPASRRAPETLGPSGDRTAPQRTRRTRARAPILANPKVDRALAWTRRGLYAAAAVIWMYSWGNYGVSKWFYSRQLAERTITLDTRRKQVLNINNLQQVVAAYDEKRRALGEIEALRLHATRVMVATAEAMGGAGRSVWLRSIRAPSTGELVYEGQAVAMADISAYLQGLAGNATFSGVALVQADANAAGNWTFTIRALLAPPAAAQHAAFPIAGLQARPGGPR